MHQYPKAYLYKRIVQAKLFVDRHFNEYMDLDNIADEAYFSKYHFIRLFKSIYGKTPHQYLIAVRVEKAKLYLQQGLPVKEVTWLVGFDSLSSFTGLFKKYTGYAPAEWQKASLERLGAVKAKPLRFIPACFAAQEGREKQF
jgi:AraC-like DNA-binding protein